MSWAIAGCLEWQRVGLAPPAAVLDATDDYFASEDVFGQWMEDCCYLDVNTVESSADVYESVKNYFESRGQKVPNLQKIEANFQKFNIKKKRTKKTRIFEGIGLI